MDFVAIDFETANRQPSSACQLAAVVVRDSQIVAEHCWSIRPPRMYFAPGNIAVHGIRPDDVRDAPHMDAVWQRLAPILDGQVLLAHNARFDMGVLVHSLAAYDIACPSLEFSCTRALARAAWPGKSGYGLKPLGNWLGISFRHHDALEDSRCCARIALAVAESAGATELAALEKILRISRGHYRHSQIVSPRMLGRRTGRQPSESPVRNTTDRWGFPTQPTKRPLGSVDPDCIVAAAASQQPLAGKRIVMLGALRGLDFSQTIDLIARLGAVVQPQIAPDTDYVVACGQPLAAASQQLGTAVAENRASKRDSTKTIRLLSERQFRALLPGGKEGLGG